jgi:hypothetical protein
VTGHVINWFTVAFETDCDTFNPQVCEGVLLVEERAGFIVNGPYGPSCEPCCRAAETGDKGT